MIADMVVLNQTKTRGLNVLSFLELSVFVVWDTVDY
jgi:hypothetical protein